MFERAAINDPITAPADQTGPHAKAWKVDLVGARRLANVKPEDDAALVIWIVEAPWAHPAWHSYAIALVHLRPLPDGRPTTIYLEGATHEIWVYALDPRKDRNRALVTGRPAFLTPVNFAAQFIAPTDQAALARVEAAVDMICTGRLSPDTDFIRHWMHLFGDNMVKDKSRAGATRLTIGEGTTAVEVVIPARPGPQDEQP